MMFGRGPYIIKVSSKIIDDGDIYTLVMIGMEIQAVGTMEKEGRSGKLTDQDDVLLHRGHS